MRFGDLDGSAFPMPVAAVFLLAGACLAISPTALKLFTTAVLRDVDASQGANFFDGALIDFLQGKAVDYIAEHSAGLAMLDQRES